MSVLIRGMEMPLSCWHSCTLKKVTIMGDVYCPLINKYMEKGEIGVRHPDCPLVEVKEPHGRLGDLDELKSKFRHSDGDNDADSAWISAIRRAITQSETIIEPEGKAE